MNAPDRIFPWFSLPLIALFSIQAAAGGQPPSGKVRLENRAMTDAGGPFLGLGATYMQALRHAKFDPDTLESNLVFLASNGFRFVRVLSMVAWPGQEIAPVDFNNFDGDPVAAWPDYWDKLEFLLDRVAAHGMRTEVTLFADAQLVMPQDAARTAHLASLLEHLAGHQEQVLLLEVANEAWQNGFPGAGGIQDLRAYGQILADATDLLVSLSSPSDLFDRVAELHALYDTSAADLAMLHFTRDIRSELGGWLPAIDPWNFLGVLPIPLMSNEPIGPGASVNTEEDPAKLVAAAAYCFLGGLPAYVFHSGAGVFFRNPFEDMAGIGDFQATLALLPADLPNWEPNDGLEATAPFTLLNGTTPNQNWSEDTSQTSGAVRNCGASRGSDFFAMPVGIQPDGVNLVARFPLSATVHHPVSGDPFLQQVLDAGETLHLPQGNGTWLIEGTNLSTLPSAIQVR